MNGSVYIYIGDGIKHRVLDESDFALVPKSMLGSITELMIKEFMQVIVDRKYVVFMRRQKLRVLWDCIKWLNREEE